MQLFVRTYLTMSQIKTPGILILILFTLALFSACQSEYDKTVKQEINSGLRHDTLLFNLTVGDTKKEFFEKCWQLNKEQLISQGSGNKYAKYFMEPDLTADSTKRVEVLFFGIFDKQNIMHGMEMKMSFTAWAPWNKEHQSDQLMSYMEERYMRQYAGNPFIKIDVDEQIKALVKVDGNRQILMFPLDNQRISVKITDLTHKEND